MGSPIPQSLGRVRGTERAAAGAHSTGRTARVSVVFGGRHAGVPALKRFLRIVTELWGSPRVRAAMKICFVAFALGMTGLAGWRFSSSGWPFSQGKPLLIAGAGLLFLIAYPVKAWGWRRLFAPAERPMTSALAAAGGAASVPGLALPGRCA